MKSQVKSKALLLWALLSGAIALIALIALIAALFVSGPAGGYNSGPGGVGGMMGGSGGMMGDIDRHFIEQMIPHHEGAVTMADLALTRAEHAELRQLAETIKRDQTREIDQMRAWYQSWYGVDAPADDSAFGGRGSSGGMMGGGMMGDDADLKVLEAAQEFDKEFIEQMIPHHQMAVMMARMLLAHSNRPEMQELARSIIESQTNEIDQMQDWYRAWYEE
ncbi:MAG: DUF305 domain-containing protein [Thermoleophilia bacterium]